MQSQDLNDALSKQDKHNKIMASTEKQFTGPLKDKTYKDVLANFKKRNKKTFKHITKAGIDFQDAMFDYMADFIFNEMLPDKYDYTKLFGLWKQH